MGGNIHFNVPSKHPAWTPQHYCVKNSDQQCDRLKHRYLVVVRLKVACASNRAAKTTLAMAKIAGSAPIAASCTDRHWRRATPSAVPCTECRPPARTAVQRIRRHTRRVSTMQAAESHSWHFFGPVQLRPPFCVASCQRSNVISRGEGEGGGVWPGYRVVTEQNRERVSKRSCHNPSGTRSIARFPWLPFIDDTVD